jgi:hypothetical protein
MYSVSLESYHSYLQPQKVLKIQKFIAFTAVCPKSLNSIYGTHSPLGVKDTRKLGNKAKYASNVVALANVTSKFPLLCIFLVPFRLH